MRPLIGTVLVLLAAVLPLFRQRGAPSWDTLWAEDGAVFFSDAHRLGGLTAITQSYAGYMLLVPRLMGAVSTLVPLRDLAVFNALAATGITALLAWFVYWAAACWIVSTPVRVALASLVAMMPALGHENTATITNLIWVLFAVTPWALLTERRRRTDTAVRCVVAFLGATSTAAAAIYVPLAAGVAMLRRDRRTWSVVATYGVGMLLQLATVMSASAERGWLFGEFPILRTPSALAELFSVRVCAVFLIGTDATAELWRAARPITMIVAPVALAGLLAVLAWGADRASRLRAALFVGYAVVGFAVPVWSRATPLLTLIPGRAYNPANMRFSIMPVLMLASTVAVLIAPPSAACHRRIARIGRRVFVAYVIGLTALDFFVTNPRSQSPRWSDSLAAAAAQCRNARADQPIQIATDHLRIFTVQLTCGDVTTALTP